MPNKEAKASMMKGISEYGEQIFKEQATLCTNDPQLCGYDRANDYCHSHYKRKADKEACINGVFQSAMKTREGK